MTTFATLGAILLLLVCTQGMNGILSLLSFERQQLASVISGYDAVGANFAGKIGRSLRLGKPLDNFVGLVEILEQVEQAGRDLKNVSIVNKNGTTVASLQPAPLVSAAMLAGITGEGKQGRHFRQGDDHFLLFALEGRGGDQAGFLCLTFSEKTLQDKRLGTMVRSLKVLGLCTLAAMIMLVLIFRAYLERGRAKGQTPLSWYLFAILGSAQVICSSYNFYLFQNDYIDLIRTKSHTVARLQQQDVEELLRRGLQLTTLLKIDQQLENTVERVPELASLTIEDRDGKVLYRGGRAIDQSKMPVEYIDLVGRQGVVGRLGIGLNSASLNETVKNIAYDSLTIVALSMLFIMELVFFLSATLLFSNAHPETADGRAADQGNLVRTAIFLFIFAASLCYSFIPLHMAELYRPVAGFSREMVLGMPLALEMLGGGLVLIPIGSWIDRKGWHQPFIVGTGLALLGTLASGLWLDPVVFMVARLVTGIGYGMAWMSAQGYVLLNTDLRHRAKGISNVVAGIFSGIICGNGMGALIAERLGYAQVFIIGAAVMGVGLLFVLLFMRGTFREPDTPPAAAGKQWSRLLRLLSEPQVLLLFSCSLLPYSVGMVGLLYYVTPLYLKALGTSQSDIGRVIMLFGLCMIFLAPRISHFADRLEDKRGLVIGGGVLAGSSLLLFYLSGSFWIVPVAVIIFGVSVSISGASRNVIMLNMPISRELGASQVMGVYRSVDKLGQTLGAMVPAALMTWFDIRLAMLIMGVGYYLLTLLLALRLRFHTDH